MSSYMRDVSCADSDYDAGVTALNTGFMLPSRSGKDFLPFVVD